MSDLIEVTGVKKPKGAGLWWLMPVILATEESSGEIMFKASPQQLVGKTLS
jgi:hypothetical protein